MDYILLQHYWWFLVSLLGALLVFLMFVQGGQTLIYSIAKSDEDRSLLINSLGRKWEFTFTTLVTFGGAFFASFPLFYSTSFGGAYYVWFAILLVFVIQAVSYEFRSKAGNLLGRKTYDMFLMINGSLAPLLIGVAVGTLFTGANFTVNFDNISHGGVISQWATPWRGLEAVLDIRNVALGVAVVMLARSLALLYFINNIDNVHIERRSRNALLVNSALFLVAFLGFLISILYSSGWGVGPEGEIVVVQYKYLDNLLEMPYVTIVMLLGVVAVLWGLALGLLTKSKRGIWPAGVGTVLTVLSLLLVAGWNDTAYYPSLVDAQSSLTIFNSSSSKFTLETMAIVSAAIPFVLAYIFYAWRSMNKRPLSSSELKNETKY